MSTMRETLTNIANLEAGNFVSPAYALEHAKQMAREALEPKRCGCEPGYCWSERTNIPRSSDSYCARERASAETSNALAYCKCSFTDPDGTVVPGEPCPIHPEK